jgi:hypothetical protein
MEEKNNEGFSDRFFHNTERPMPRGCTSDDNKGSSFSNSGIFTSSRPNSPASKPLHEASPGFKNRPVPRGMLSSSSSTFGLSNTTDCTVSNLSRQELTPERIKGRYDEKKEEDIGGKHDLQDGSTNHTSAARIHQETSFYSPFRVNTRHLSSFEDRPGSISTSLFSVTNLPVNTSHRLLSQSIKSSRDTREKYYLNNTIQNALSPRRLANKSSVASDTPVATTREKHLERSHEKEEAMPTSSINSNDSSMIVTEANDEDNGFIPTTSRTTLDEDHIAQVQESDLTKEEKKEVGTKHQELRPEATLPPVPASLLSPDSSTALSEKQRLTVDLQAKEQDPNQSSLTSPIPLTISRGTTSGITAVIRDISNFDAHKRETWYNFRTKVRKCFCELDDMIEKHRDLFKSDPATVSQTLSPIDFDC